MGYSQFAHTERLAVRLFGAEHFFLQLANVATVCEPCAADTASSVSRANTSQLRKARHEAHTPAAFCSAVCTMRQKCGHANAELRRTPSTELFASCTQPATQSVDACPTYEHIRYSGLEHRFDFSNQRTTFALRRESTE